MTGRIGAIVLAGLLWGAAAQTSLAQDDPGALKAKLLRTYAGLNTYSSATHFEHRETQQAGGWVESLGGDFHLALDRKNARFTYTKPDIQIYCDGQNLRVKDDNHPGRYLELPAVKPLTYEGLTDQINFADRPSPVELALLLSPDPLKTIHGADVTSMKVLAPDAQKRPGLESTSALGKLTLRMDPVSGLVTQAIIDVDVQALGNGATKVMEFDIAPGKTNQPLAANQFTFSPAGLQRSGSLVDWSAQGGGDAQGGQAGAGAAPGAPGAPGGAADPGTLEGHPAPAVELKTFDGKTYRLADDKSDVIIFDFWATWCGPCVAWLPYMEHVQAWARAGNKSVSIYAVDEGEPMEQIRAFSAQHGLFLPVLLDSDSSVGKAYLANGIPETVIISKGKVVHVHVGMDPGGPDLVMKQIDDILNPPAAPAAPAGPAAQGAPAPAQAAIR